MGRPRTARDLDQTHRRHDGAGHDVGLLGTEASVWGISGLGLENEKGGSSSTLF